MPISNLENEMRVGAMIRTMSGEMRDDLRDQIYELYADKDGNTEGYRESCARWHWLLLVYSMDLKQANKYVALIQQAFKKQVDLDQNDRWKFMMRMFLPEQAIKQIKNGPFTQVPKLAIINQTPLAYKNKKEEKEKAIFRLY